MKVRLLLILAVFLLVNSVLMSQTIRLDYIGLNGPNAEDSQTVAEGDLISVKLKYETSGFSGAFGKQRGVSLGGPGSVEPNKLMVFWIGSDDGDLDNYVYDEFVTITSWSDANYNDVVTKLISFDLPSPPDGALSFVVIAQVRGRSGTTTYVYSDELITEDEDSTPFYSYLKLDLNTAPVASDVVITNATHARVGQTLTGSYVYSDADDDIQGATSFRWLRSTDANPLGAYVAITGATSQTYTLTTTDLNRFIKFEVTPRALTGVLIGEAVTSDYSDQVMAAASISIDASTTQVVETGANNGSVSGNILVNLVNADFTATVTGVSVSGLPDGLSVGTITRNSNSQISIQITGNATEHELASSIDNTTTLKVTVPDYNMQNVSEAKTTPTGFRMLFHNNPVDNLTVHSVGNNKVVLAFDKPLGLKTSGTAISNYRIYRNNVLIRTEPYVAATTTYYYTDSAVTTGSHYAYRISANYSNTSDADDPEASISATPLAITAYSFSNPAVSGTIDHDAQTICVIVPHGTVLTNLVATFTAPSADVKIGSTVQTSGVTANNFSTSAETPIVYTLTNGNTSTTHYTVTVLSRLPVPTTVEGTTTTSSINPKWNPIAQANRYILDVSTSESFASYLPGFEAKDMGTTSSIVINNLDPDTNYYYRVRSICDDNADLSSAYSATVTVTTDATTAGTGSSQINGTDPQTINVGSFVQGEATITPSVTIAPASFTGDPYEIEVNVAYGTTGLGYPNVGMHYTIGSANAGFINGTFNLNYSGLGYHPISVGWRYNGGAWTINNSPVIDEDNNTVSVVIGGLKQYTKAENEIEIIFDDGSGSTLPVELSSFNAVLLTGGRVRLDWITQSETGVNGFFVLRGQLENMANALVVSPLIQATNTSSQAVYAFEDREIPANGTYYYWLQSVDINGTIGLFGPITVNVTNGDDTPPIIPLVTSLRNTYPNPFNPTLRIAYDIATPSDVRIEIYNIKGQLVKTLINEQKQPGAFSALWQGQDENGRNVSTGTYYVRMTAGNYQNTRKVVMIK